MESRDELQAKIEDLEAEIESIYKYLPYADGGAYGQDLDKISKIREEISGIKRTLEETK